MPDPDYETEWSREDLDRILHREVEPPCQRDTLPALAAALIILLLAAVGLATLTWIRDDVRTVRHLVEDRPCRP